MKALDPVVADYLVSRPRSVVYRDQLRVVLAQAAGNVAAAALALGLTRRAVYLGVRKYKLDLDEWRE